MKEGIIMPNYAKDGEVMYHTGLTKEMIKGAKYALVPGDPGRVEGLAKPLIRTPPLSPATETSPPGPPK